MRAVPQPLGTSSAVGKPTRPTAQLAGAIHSSGAETRQKCSRVNSRRKKVNEFPRRLPWANQLNRLTIYLSYIEYHEVLSHYRW